MDNIGDIAVIDESLRSDLHISDVLEVITHDPQFGGGEVEAAMGDRPAPPLRPYVRIVEQPASKALRFRYECEGRSAGSIPGANSTPQEKTYPTIEICDYPGKAVVVVSCVTKDQPYRPHPHNLVGRELCKKGVCTVKFNGDSPRVSFSNLGIQCVKRRDIEDALRVREELKVDPFKTGFSHKNQPQNIDLNAVRLCFQVFLLDESSGKIRNALQPVVSDVIYDKKAMSDLVISKISHRSASVLGGQQVILCCEKVAREDISVSFFELRGGVESWRSESTDLHVHKQVALVFRTPRYRDVDVQEHVQVFVQLRRPSDNATSDPIEFELIPSHYSGNILRKQPADLTLLEGLLHRDDNNNANDKEVSSTTDSVNNSDESGSANIADTSGNDGETMTADEAHEKSLNDLLDQVAELDEIYTENRIRLQNAGLSHSIENDEEFNDAGTYTSLQLAFKNPVQIAEPESYSYEDVQTYRGPIIEFSPLKREVDDAPPLPPKRVKKAPSIDTFKTSQSSVVSLLKPGKQIQISRNNDYEKEISTFKSEPALPPVKKRSFFSRLFRKREKSPATSVKSEGKKEKKSKFVGRSVSSVSGQRPSKFKSAVSHTSLKDNASTTGLSYADSITHISLHADDNEKSVSQTSLRRPASLAPLPPTDVGTILVAESVIALDANAFKKLQDDLDLTEAEHYALYMAVAPHATVSEFDETSAYYAPIDGKSLRPKRKKPLIDIERFSIPVEHDMNQQYPDYYTMMPQQNAEIKPVKLEPLERTSPRLYPSPHMETTYTQWPLDKMSGGGLVMAGTSQYPQWGTPSPSVSPNMQPVNMRVHMLPNMSPNMHQTMSPNIGQTMQAMSPNNMPHNMQAMSPNMQAMSPNMQAMSPNMQAMSPNMQAMSPNMQAMSPNMQHAPMGHVSPNLTQMSNVGQCVSPVMGHVSPNLQHQQQQPMAHVNLPQNPMDSTCSDPPSITRILQYDDENMNSTEMAQLSGLSGLLGD